MDDNSLVKLKDFASERGVPDNTVRKYISLHPEFFAGHIHYDNFNKNAMYLDKEAVSWLSHKYKISTEVITNNDLMERMDVTNDAVLSLAGKVIELTETMKNKAIDDKKPDKDILKRVEELEKYRSKVEDNRIKELQERIEKLEAENEKLRHEKEIEFLEAEMLRHERMDWINDSYVNLCLRRNKLRREMLKNEQK